MAAFNETATERLLREVREQQKLMEQKFKGLQPFAQISEQANAITKKYDQFVRPMREVVERIHQTTSRFGTGGATGALRAPPSKTSASKPQGHITTAAELGPIIRKARKVMKLSQGEFAAHAGVGRRFVSELESGKASLEFDKVLACAAAAGVDIFARPRSLLSRRAE